MHSTFWTAFSTSVAAAFVTTLGIWTIRRYAAWGQRNAAYFMCFAAGVLISASFLHMIPKAFSLNEAGPAFLLAGFFGMHLFNRFLTAFVCERDPDRKDYAIGLIPMLGIGFHSFIDGCIYSIAFTVSVLTGFMATVGMVLHEFPEGIVTYVLLVKGGLASARRPCWPSLRLRPRRRWACSSRGPWSGRSTRPRWARCFRFRRGRWSTSARPTCSRRPSRRSGDTAWSRSPAACSWRSSSSRRKPEGTRSPSARLRQACTPVFELTRTVLLRTVARGAAAPQQ